jgi:hypothetical protein
MYSCLYEFFRDQGSLIAGVLALIAGVIAYYAGVIQARTAREGVDRQLAAAIQRDRAGSVHCCGHFTRTFTIGGDAPKGERGNKSAADFTKSYPETDNS